MNWSFHQQVLYALGAFFLISIIASAMWFFVLYEKPSCADGVLNQDEAGIDCGGVCANLCEAPKVAALWSRAVKIAPGVYHAVALVRNPEPMAGTRSLPYTFSLFDSENILIAERRGVMHLDPGEIAPLFEGSIVTGERTPARTFVTFDVGEWSTMDRVSFPVRIVSQVLDTKSLRLTANVENTSSQGIRDITVSALLYAQDEMLVTASQTILSELGPREVREIIFTWQEPFPVDILRADIIPRRSTDQ